MFERLVPIRLIAVAPTGRVFEVADRLELTQPALTRAIAHLKARYGAALFSWPPAGGRPTALGRVFFRLLKTVRRRSTESSASPPGGYIQPHAQSLPRHERASPW